MKTTTRGLLIAGVILAGLAMADGAEDPNRPTLGFLYSAGGQAGTTITIIAGGQKLRGVREVFVTGEGVTGKIIKHFSGRRLSSDQRREVARLLREARKTQVAALRDAGQNKNRRRKPERKRKPKPERKPAATKGDKARKEPVKEVKLPDHYLLKDLEKRTLRELKKIQEFFFDPAIQQQMSPQIAERVLIELVIASDAPPGDRELRLRTPNGVTNPMRFCVGLLPEISEIEVNDFTPMRLPATESPFVLNGQVDRRDIDQFRFTAKKGQKLVLETKARQLVPYMADAVPGWFQATLMLSDPDGREVCFVDDYRFDPDPVLLFLVPKTGDYVLTVKDAIFRGRADFVYRITIGEIPFITRMFPLGGRAGAAAVSDVTGWNLPFQKMELDTSVKAGTTNEVTMRWKNGRTNRLLYRVDDLPEALDTGSNDTIGTAQAITLPVIVNGRIEVPGDHDVFRFEGRAGEEVVVEAECRALESPLDSVLQLTGPNGDVVDWNDDREDRRIGLNTHQADSYLRVKLPSDGSYRVRISDAQNHGGEAYGYRLRVSPPRPDFTVITTPSALSLREGGTVPFTAHIIRRDGFDGIINLELAGAPEGFSLGGGRIGPGRDRVQMTLTAPQKALKRPVRLELEATEDVGGGQIRRRVIPAEDMMQAFLNRHLVPAKEFIAVVNRGRTRIPPMELMTRGAVQIPTDGSVRVLIKARGLPDLSKITFKLADAPEGVTLRDVGVTPHGLLLVLAGRTDPVKVGWGDNLIVEIYATYQPPRRGKRRPPARSVLVGVLPAIPFEFAAPRDQ